MVQVTMPDYEYDRYDVMEFMAAILPLAHANNSLPDKSWRFLLAYSGVDNITAYVDTDSSAKLSGEFDTHPKQNLEITFSAAGELYQIESVTISG